MVNGRESRRETGDKDEYKQVGSMAKSGEQVEGQEEGKAGCQTVGQTEGQVGGKDGVSRRTSRRAKGGQEG